MLFVRIAHRATALLMTTALVTASLPATAQQMAYGQSRWQINQQRAMAYEQQSAARVPLIAEAMRLIHAAYPNQPQQWSYAGEWVTTEV